MLCNRSVTPLSGAVAPLMNPKVASAHPVSPEFVEKAITEFPKFLESIKPTNWPDYLQQSTTPKGDEPDPLAIAGKNIFDEHEVTTPSQSKESSPSTLDPAGLNHPPKSSEVPTAVTYPAVKHSPVDEHGEQLVKVKYQGWAECILPRKL